MNDLISRQTAIDALKAYAKKYNAYPIAVYDAVGVLQRVPPAHPEPCEDAVSRRAAIDGLNDAVHEHNITDFDAVATILALPPVTPKQRTGKWIDGIIPNDSGGLPVIVCDQCNTFFPLQFGDGHNFCPNCGAKMEGDAE